MSEYFDKDMNLIQIVHFVLIYGVGKQVEGNEMNSIFNLAIVLCTKDDCLNKAEVMNYLLKPSFMFGNKCFSNILRFMAGNGVEEVETVYKSTLYFWRYELPKVTTEFRKKRGLPLIKVDPFNDFLIDSLGTDIVNKFKTRGDHVDHDIDHDIPEQRNNATSVLYYIAGELFPIARSRLIIRQHHTLQLQSRFDTDYVMEVVFKFPEMKCYIYHSLKRVDLCQ